MKPIYASFISPVSVLNNPNLHLLPTVSGYQTGTRRHDAIRELLEECMLLRELEGYDIYMAQVNIDSYLISGSQSCSVFWDGPFP